MDKFKNKIFLKNKRKKIILERKESQDRLSGDYSATSSI